MGISVRTVYDFIGTPAAVAEAKAVLLCDIEDLFERDFLIAVDEPEHLQLSFDTWQSDDTPSAYRELTVNADLAVRVTEVTHADNIEVRGRVAYAGDVVARYEGTLDYVGAPDISGNLQFDAGSATTWPTLCLRFGVPVELA